MKLLKPLLVIFQRKAHRKRPVTRLNDLDDDALLLIFDSLPLHDLLTLKAVCPRWSTLVPAACKRRRSLTLLVGSRKWYRSIKSTTPALDEMVNDDGFRAAGWWSNYALVHKTKWPQLLTELDAPTCEWMVATFPNINTLRVAQNSVSYDSADNLIFLLKSWRSKLINLKLMSFYKRETKRKRNGHFFVLMTIINCLPTLKRLSLDIFHRLDSTLDLTILGQLEAFSFYSRDHVDKLLQMIKLHCATNPKLQNIALKNTLSYHDVSFPSTLQMDRTLACRFTELRLESILPIAEFEQFCSLFTNLKVLLVRLRGESMARVSRALTPLHQLKCLHLAIEYPKALLEEDDILHPLPTVKGLSLTLKLVSHVELERLAIDRTFPSLQVLGISRPVLQCTSCSININRRLGSLWIKRMLCTRRLCKPLKKCTELKCVYSDQQMYWRFDPKIQVINRDVFEV